MDLNKKIRNFAKIIPGGKMFDNYIRKITYHSHYKTLLNANSISEDKLLILATVARSGTHYVMLLLTNYINLLNGSGFQVGPSEMNKILPNNWHLNYMSYHKLPLGPFIQSPPKKPNKLIKSIGLDEITRSHSLFQSIYWKKSQILHLYRNPLDYSVSLYNYKHKKRSDLPNRCKNPSEVMELKFENYCDMYNSYKKASKSGRYRILRISYENLIQNPNFYLGSIISWLGNEPDYNVIDKAVNFSSINKVQKAEEKGGNVNPDAKDLKGSFISSGKIGQWKNYYSNEDFTYWKDRFKNKGIDLNSFILD